MMIIHQQTKSLAMSSATKPIYRMSYFKVFIINLNLFKHRLQLTCDCNFILLILQLQRSDLFQTYHISISLISSKHKLSQIYVFGPQ